MKGMLQSRGMNREAKIAWAAGFYEGEGSFGVRHNPYGHPTSLRMSVAQRTEQPLQWFLEVIQIGKIQYRVIRGGDFWNWVAGKTENSIAVARLLYPYLSDRRREQILVSVDEFLSVRHILEYDFSFLEGEVATPILLREVK